jgi:arylsulfatase
VSWPAKIHGNGGIRTQFHHVIDVVPTILEAASIKEPTEVGGTEQVPIAGVSMEYSFDNAEDPGKRLTQYFETGGHRAIYNDGWVAASFHGVPWALTGSVGFADSKWELYNIDKDFSEAHDVAAKFPEKLVELERMFDVEAEKFNVFPLDDRFVERGVVPDRPSFTKGRTSFVYSPGTVRIPEGNAPPIYQRSHTITAKIEVPSAGANGVIIATGGSSGGYTLYLAGGRPVYEYNFFGQQRFKVEGETALSAGPHTIELEYTQLPFQKFKEVTGGPARLLVDGKEVGKGEIAAAVPGRFSATETLDIGMDLGSVVTPAYMENAPFAFTGRIETVRIDFRE